MKYAENTTVTPERSRAEIERTLARYGATRFAYMVGDQEAMIGFCVHGRLVRFVVGVPGIDEFRKTQKGQRRSQLQAEKAQEQAVRQIWRALALAVKAKLELVEGGVVTFDQEFMAHIVLPQTNKTIGETFVPQIATAYTSGAMPKLLAEPQ